MSAERTTYNLVLGTHEDGSVIILDEIFRYGDGFTGATGSVVRPVTEADIKQAMSEKVEYLRETADDVDAHGAARRAITGMLKDEYLEYRFETYRGISPETIAATLGVEVPERYTLEGIGRIFSSFGGRSELDDITLIDSDEVRAAIEAINAAETKS